jgi:hypothetical protein
MKKLLAAFVILSICIASNAQDTSLLQTPQLQPHSEQDTSREKIQIRDLPKAVRESLKAPDYAGWTIDSAYKALMRDPERPESVGLLVYIVELRRRDERSLVRFDKEGKRLDENSLK